MERETGLEPATLIAGSHSGKVSRRESGFLATTAHSTSNQAHSPETAIWEASLCPHYVNCRAPSLHFRLNQHSSHHPATQSQIWSIRADSESHPSLAPKGLTPAVWTRSPGDAGSPTGISIMGSHGPKVSSRSNLRRHGWSGPPIPGNHRSYASLRRRIRVTSTCNLASSMVYTTR